MFHCFKVRKSTIFCASLLSCAKSCLAKRIIRWSIDLLLQLIISSFLLCSRGIVSCGVSSRGGQTRGSLGRLLGLAETARCCHQSLHRGWVSSVQSRLSSSLLASIQKSLKNEAEFSFILSLSVVQSKLSRQRFKLGSGTKQCRL